MLSLLHPRAKREKMRFMPLLFIVLKRMPAIRWSNPHKLICFESSQSHQLVTSVYSILIFLFNITEPRIYVIVADIKDLMNFAVSYVTHSESDMLSLLEISVNYHNIFASNLFSPKMSSFYLIIYRVALQIFVDGQK